MDGLDRRIWSAGGALAAIVLGMALTPLREWTTASNLAFAFIAVTIVMAELGGRSAAVVTAAVSAMSLNFFLTAPYLTLVIDKPDDVIAFVALLACGLIAAAFGQRRAASFAAVRRSQHDLDGLRDLIIGVQRGASLAELLRRTRDAFGLGRLVLRYPDERVAAADPEEAPAPTDILDADTLLEREPGPYRWGGRGFRLPPGGGRLRLETAAGPVVMDLWEGRKEGLEQNERRALAVAAASGHRGRPASRPLLNVEAERKTCRARRDARGRSRGTAPARKTLLALRPPRSRLWKRRVVGPPNDGPNGRHRRGGGRV